MIFGYIMAPASLLYMLSHGSLQMNMAFKGISSTGKFGQSDASGHGFAFCW
jgi:hypothetical protein